MTRFGEAGQDDHTVKDYTQNMKKLTIQTGANNPILRTVSKDIKKFDASLKKFAKEMKITMIEDDGLGLAAPQVGKNIRMVMVTLNYKTKQQVVTTMVNPKIISHGDETAIAEEGCLSLPNIYEKVERFVEIILEFMNLDGSKQVLALDDLNARVVQHEIDHLDAVLFIDRAQALKKSDVEMD